MTGVYTRTEARLYLAQFLFSEGRQDTALQYLKIPLLVLALPLLDMVWVVLLRWRIGQPFYQGDTNHISHRLVRRGLTRWQAVVVIWAVAEGLALLAYLC